MVSDNRNVDTLFTSVTTCCKLGNMGISQATRIFRYKNIKRKIIKCCASIYFNKQCLKYNLIPNYSRINIPHTSPASTYNQRKIYKMRTKDEINFLYTKKANLNKTLFQTHLNLANEWGNAWHIISNAIHLTLETEIQNTYEKLDKKLDGMKHSQQT